MNTLARRPNSEPPRPHSGSGILVSQRDIAKAAGRAHARFYKPIAGRSATTLIDPLEVEQDVSYFAIRSGAMAL